MSTARVPALEIIGRKGIHVDFYDPDGSRYGMPTYPYRWAPEGLLTRRQLRARGLRPGGQRIAAQIIWKYKGRRRVAYLYRADLAKPRRQPSPAQLLAIQAALRARRTCPTCGHEQDYYIPLSRGECNTCAARWGR
jgi:hypothetical protein